MSAPPLYPDRRASVRNAVSMPITYGAGDTWLEGRVVDISASGLGITGPRIFPVGAAIDLRFGVLPGKGHLLTVAAAVRYAQGTRMGLEFVNLGAGDHRKMLETIQQLIAHLPHPEKE